MRYINLLTYDMQQFHTGVLHRDADDDGNLAISTQTGGDGCDFRPPEVSKVNGK